jgi:hypothetical protein
MQWYQPDLRDQKKSRGELSFIFFKFSFVHQLHINIRKALLALKCSRNAFNRFIASMVIVDNGNPKCLNSNCDETNHKQPEKLKN